MEKLNELANFIGFGSLKGMLMYFAFLGIIAVIGLIIYYGQKPINKT